MFCNIAGDDTRTIVTFVFLLFPASLYIMGLMRGSAGRYLFLSAVAVHLGGIVLRGVQLGTVPLTEKHDTISFVAFSMALAYWFITRRREIRNLDILALPLIALFALTAFLYMPIDTISPFMKTFWFYLHSFLYFGSYGIFGLSFCVGALYLAGGDNELEYLQYKAVMLGWILFTLSLIAGSIWFYVAHGMYWLWTSKELWVTLTWFYYGLYLHSRMMQGFRGRRASFLGVLGFAVALFTYFGVGTIIPSPPTQF